MANPVNKAVLPIAAQQINKFNLPSQHLTTANWMEFVPSFCRVIVPHSHGVLNHKTFMRCEPLDKPCLGSASVHSRAFFVPFRTVWDPFTDFVNDVPHTTAVSPGLIANVPTTTFEHLQTVFTNSGYGATTSGTSTSYDFEDGGNYYTLTSRGRRWLKVLESLGYKIPFGSVKNLPSISALPILCYAKVFLDWYWPTAYAHTLPYYLIDGLLNRDDTFVMSHVDISAILAGCGIVAYDNDFMTSIWDSPVGPNSGAGSVDFSIKDVTLPDPFYVTSGSTLNRNGQVTQASNGTPYTGVVAATSGTSDRFIAFSQYLDSTLHALTNYLQRHRLAGCRSLDRALATWGITLSADKLKRCYYLGEDSFPFEIGDVMSTSDTAGAGGASLGAYAGKGIAYSQGHKFEFDNDEFGMLFVFTTIVPDVSYVSGIDRNVMNISKLDFLTPEFDCLGVSAVGKGEVLVDNAGSAYNNGLFALTNSPFGFAPRYYEYKIPYSRQTGLYNYKSVNGDLNGWSTMRLFDPANYGTGGASLTHNLGFVVGADAEQYNRIFLGSKSGDDIDPFYVVHRDDLELYSPMKPLYDNYDWEELQNAKMVSTEPNGVKLN